MIEALFYPPNSLGAAATRASHGASISPRNNKETPLNNVPLSALSSLLTTPSPILRERAVLLIQDRALTGWKALSYLYL